MEHGRPITSGHAEPHQEADAGKRCGILFPSLAEEYNGGADSAYSDPHMAHYESV